VTDPTSERDQTLHPYVEFCFAADPVLASEQGDHRRSDSLGDADADALAAQADARRRMLDAAEAEPVPADGSVAWLEHQVLLTELRTAVAQDEHVRAWQRAPYWYPERLGDALSVLMAGGDPAEQGRALLGRLRQIPGYLVTAKANLTTDTPPLWAEMGQASATGLSRFLDTAVTGFAGTLPSSLAADVTAAAAAAQPGVQDFASWCAELAGRGTGRWQGGREYFDRLLRDFQHLDVDADGLAESGRQRVDAEQARLDEFAAALDPARGWREQIDAVKSDHPEPADLLQAYGSAMRDAARHTEQADLLAVPDGETCVMDWVPEYRREGLPLGCMATSPPFATGLRSEFLITPNDPAAPEPQRAQHMRDNCFVFISSIAGHETYPGHHLQAVHHKLGTPVGSIRRFVPSPQSVEGWGLYTEDLLEESGFMRDDRVRLFKRRNALWRALRIVIDTGLHTSALTVPQAVDLLVDRAGMDRHMAAGEVRRYTRHDNPTYPSSYALGRDGFHRVRERARVREGAGFSLRSFHDRLLSFGSPPVALVGRVLDAEDPLPHRD
jgi:hypothetical protein